MAIIANIRKLRELVLKKADLLAQMEHALMHEWEKGTPLLDPDALEARVKLTGVEMKPHVPFMQTLKQYHEARLNGRDTVRVFGMGTIPTDYVEYLLDYAEPRALKGSMHYINSLANHIAAAKRKFRKAMQEKQNVDP